jgi:hypothetical protein
VRAELLSSAQGYDTSTDVPTARDAMVAARHLVDYRDGLVGALMWTAEQTADLSCPDSAVVLQRLLLVLGKDEAYRRAAQIATLATPCWGMFREIGAQRIASVDLLHKVCRDTANAVRDEMQRDSCICRDVR